MIKFYYYYFLKKEYLLNFNVALYSFTNVNSFACYAGANFQILFAKQLEKVLLQLIAIYRNMTYAILCAMYMTHFVGWTKSCALHMTMTNVIFL